MVVNNENAFLFNVFFKRVIVAISHDKGYNVLPSLLSLLAVVNEYSDFCNSTVERQQWYSFTRDN